jgi:type II secretory pathway component PulC
MRAASVVLLLAACASTPKPRPGELTEGTLMREEAPPTSSSDTPKEPLTSRPAPITPSPGTLRRAELVRVLDAAPGNFLRHVQTEPRFHGGRFTGWRLTAFYPGDSRFSGVDLQAGDVVVRVNGRSIEQPEQLMVVWDALRQAPELVVELERDGRPRTLRWTIVDP